MLEAHSEEEEWPIQTQFPQSSAGTQKAEDLNSVHLTNHIKGGDQGEVERRTITTFSMAGTQPWQRQVSLDPDGKVLQTLEDQVVSADGSKSGGKAEMQ